ncbi:MAG TPA: sigma-70 family RNA polymerase sigma factor, partial [Polyangiaceae bacterium]|nr:sigma-70 family RNA polymerase sigma factor [Polyangiaceae bacterium]
MNPFRRTSGATPERDEVSVELRVTPAAPLEFRSVYLEHFDFACRSLRLLGVAPGALEDAAQDVFGIVCKRLGEFTGEASLRTWIFAIVQRVASNQRRTQRRKQRPLEPLTEPLATLDPSPEAHAEAAQAASLVQLFCDTLDEGRRAVFVLVLVEDVPAREVAQALEIPLFTVYSRIRALREQLQEFLESREVEK